MGALAVDMQLDFWAAPEPEPAGRPALAAVVRDVPGGGERTLEEYILSAWEELAAHQAVDCPICGSEMVAARVSTLDDTALGDTTTRGAACGRCGTQLS